jgi:hypothetical protein
MQFGSRCIGGTAGSMRLRVDGRPLKHMVDMNMVDKERSRIETCAGCLGRRAPRRLTAIMGALGAAAMTFAFAAPAQASVEYYSSLTFKYADGHVDQFGGVPRLTVPQTYSLSGTSGAGYVEASDVNGGTAAASASIVLQFLPAAQRLEEIDAVSLVTYRFTLSGPNTGNTVPVLLLGSGSSAGGQNFLSFQNAFNSDYENTGNFVADQVLNLVPGWGYVLVLRAEAAVATGNLYNIGDTMTASAAVDPTLTILGPDAQLYHFDGLPDSTIGGPMAAVPEPATWAMMLSGFGLVGSAMRRRRRASLRLA